jgi:hypothetical protein
MADVLFYGRVLPGGLLVWENPKDYNRAVRALSGKHVEGIIRKRRTKRTSKANAYYFGVGGEATGRVLRLRPAGDARSLSDAVPADRGLSHHRGAAAEAHA